VPDLLTSQQLRTFRRDWIGDLVDDRVEWGATPAVAVAADAGDASLQLTGLGEGVVTKGTPFSLVLSDRAFRHFVSSDSSIASGDATITFTPRLSTAVPEGTRVYAEPIRRSIYNKNTDGALFFSDPELQELARRAKERWTAWIAQESNAETALFIAMRVLAYETMLGDSNFRSVVEYENPDAENYFARLREQLGQDAMRVDVREKGAGVIRLVR
jgi:hypothetical protein